MSAAEGVAWGFFNALHPSAELEREARGASRARSPTARGSLTA